MTTYSKAPAELIKLTQDVMRRYHGGLNDVGVLVDVLLAFPAEDANGDAVGPAITVAGYAATACIKIISYKDRVVRGHDAEITIDGNCWDVASEAERTAILDHELTHLELITDAAGSVKRDDAERPRLRMRKHDRHFGWFDVVAHRHGEASLEVRQARAMLDSQAFKQCYLFDVNGDDEDTSSGDPENENADDPLVSVVDHGRPLRMKRSRVADHIIDSCKRQFAGSH